MIWRRTAGTGKECREIYVAIWAFLSLAFQIISRYCTISAFPYPVPSPRLPSPSFMSSKKTYITGMELSFEDTTKISIGYKIPGQQVMRDVKLWRGFEVAVGSGGIHALRIVTDTTSSQWLGRPDGACPTTRLVLASHAEIGALEVALDVSYRYLYPNLLAISLYPCTAHTSDSDIKSSV